jgi:tRNA U34 5-carboxymethylaminomethyl modifying enzyme MnmG/GidA
MDADALKGLADQLRSAGFAEVTVLTGTPPRLDHAAIQSNAA